MARPSSDQLDLLAMIEADAQAEIDGRRQAEEDAHGVPRLFSTSHPRACDYVLAYEAWCERWGHFGSRVISRAWVPAELWLDTRVAETTTELCQPLVLQADLRCHCLSKGCSCVGGLVYRSICTRCGWHSDVTSSDTAAATLGLDHAHEGWRDMPIMRPAPFDDSTSQRLRRAWEDEVHTAYGHRPNGFPVITDRPAPGLRAVPGNSPWGGYDVAADTIERRDTLW